MNFASGSLVHARGREWVVLPESTRALTLLRPLGGTDAEVTGILNGLEPVEPARFPLPDPADTGDFRSCKLLRDALRLGFRSSAGPFRAFGNINVEPRPYQLVPLLLALKLDPVRLLIADDVGVGKTVESSLIARELFDRGEIRRLAVLCPPHLAEQWQRELLWRFNFNAELVLSSTVRRLTRHLGLNQSLFEVYPITVISTDFVKSERNRNEFLREAPELIIVDEAHTCTSSGQGPKHQRHRLLKDLAASPARHLILVTATPHSGNEGAFRSLLEILNPKLGELPVDLTGPQHESDRRALAAHFVQRRRADLRSYLDETTPFPKREDAEDTYKLHPDYRRLFDRALQYARETVAEQEGDTRFRRRIRWWSALALLRALASSPAAAAATLRSRSAIAGSQDDAWIDAAGAESVLDLVDEAGEAAGDVAPGADWVEGEGDAAKRERARLRDMARQAESLEGDKDAKLLKAVALVRGLLNDGFSPIVFCRFIDTAEYLAAELQKRLGASVTVGCVTGLLSPEDRETRVTELEQEDARVLVCTDCLSEGINLQNAFDAVFHYDLSWNPTRHEQRDGRVDRFGQRKKTVRSLTFYGTDNRIDGIVLEVLLRKHRTIRSSLGVSVPIPVNSEQIVDAIFEGLLLRAGKNEPSSGQLDLSFLADFEPQKRALHRDWEDVAIREKQSQTMFAQRGIRADEVAAELTEARAASGSSRAAAEFLEHALRAAGAGVRRSDGALKSRADQAPAEIVAAAGLDRNRETSLLLEDLHRTHRAVQGLASQVLSAALDPRLPKELRVARRAGVIRTGAVKTRTTLLLLRVRFHILRRVEGAETPLLAEDSLLAAFAGSPASPAWLNEENIEALLEALPSGNVPSDLARVRIEEVITHAPAWMGDIDGLITRKADALLESHQRVRTASRVKGVRYEVIPHRPADLLGIFQFLPAA